MKRIASKFQVEFPAASVWRLPSGNLFRVASADVRSVSGCYAEYDPIVARRAEPLALSLRFMKRCKRVQGEGA